MNRKNFLKLLFGASTLLTTDGFAHLINATMTDTPRKNNLADFATYGAIHLNNTSLEKAIVFWTKIVGMTLRSSSGDSAEFGTETQTLVVVHETATTGFKKGYSGLYHFAIHAPNKAEFARMVNRLNAHNYPYSPIDHTMSKSVYLDDPDGINVEFTLETPEEFKGVITSGGLKIEGSDGVVRSASERLDVSSILSALEDSNLETLLSDDSYLGHVHLYANSVSNSFSFYQKMGFIPFNNFPQFMYADLGAGGDYQHRIVMNSWHGQNKPLAPAGSAGMKHFQINFKSQDKLNEAICTLPDYKEDEKGYWFKDPTGNNILLSKIKK